MMNVNKRDRYTVLVKQPMSKNIKIHLIKKFKLLTISLLL